MKQVGLRLGVFVLALGCASALSACHSGGGAGRNAFSLQWASPGPGAVATPTIADGFKHHQILLQPLNDARAEPGKIGVWQNEGGKPVTTSTNVAEWVHANMTKMLGSAGAKLVSTGETVEMRGEITDFNCIEDDQFVAEVKMRFNVVVGGRATWEGAYTGHGKKWGGTHNPENFNEALTLATQEVVRQLVVDESFGKALAAVGK